MSREEFCGAGTNPLPAARQREREVKADAGLKVRVTCLAASPLRAADSPYKLFPRSVS